MAGGAKSGELMLTGGKKAQRRKPSSRNWSKAKESRFLSVLGETCNVSAACAGAGVSVSHAYRRRKADAGFRAGWAEAISIAYHRLELVLLERALNGTEKVIVKVDGREERMREYPNAIALTLLRLHRDTAIEAEAEVEPDDVEEIRERILAKLERLREREVVRAEASAAA